MPEESCHGRAASTPDDTGQSRQQRIKEILAAFLSGVAADRAKHRQKLLADHPGLAEELAPFLEDHDWTEPLAQSPRRSAAVSPYPSHDEAAPGDRAFPSLNVVALAEQTCDLDSISPGRKPGRSLPCRYGDYELTEEIGRGGMGIV